MIVTRTPLRVSFVGGGTDFKEFYTHRGGSVISTTIDKYVYVTVKQRFDDAIRVAYSMMELVNNVDEIQHGLVRECLKRTGIDRGVEIATFADIPSEGCGLGSSSALTIGLLNAFYSYTGIRKSPEELAREACAIEIDILLKPIGKQDQYIAAYGGVQHIVFKPDDTVEVKPVPLTDRSLRALHQRLMLFYTGMTRKSIEVLSEQKERMREHFATLDKMSSLVPLLKECMLNGVGREFGELLDRNWRCKKQLASNISNPEIDAYYEQALRAGAVGGKICGAGGGGFLLLYCVPEKQQAVIEATRPLRHVPFRIGPLGSTLLLNPSEIAQYGQPLSKPVSVKRKVIGAEMSDRRSLRCPTCGKPLLVMRGADKHVLRTRIVIFDNGTSFAKCPSCKSEVAVPIKLIDEFADGRLTEQEGSIANPTPGPSVQVRKRAEDRSRESRPRAARKREKVSGLDGKSVLVIDRDKAVREFFRLSLGRVGVDVIFAGSVEKGINLVHSRRFDAAFIEMMLPTMTGFSVLEKIKREMDLDTVVYMMAREPEKQHIDMSSQLGASGVIDKSESLKDVALLLRRALQPAPDVAAETSKKG